MRPTAMARIPEVIQAAHTRYAIARRHRGGGLALMLVLSCGGAAGSPNAAAPTGAQATSQSPLPSSSLQSSAPSAPSAPAMAGFERDGYFLEGAEYWPYIGTAEPKYPDEILWGFYPKKGVVAPNEVQPSVDDATPAAVACAERAYAELVAFLASDPPLLRQLASDPAGAGYNPGFYLWTNDYTRAATPFPAGTRPARLWYWKRREAKPGRPPGFWKWESTVDQQGTCHTPKKEQVLEYLTRAVAETNALAQLAPGCRGTALKGKAIAACAAFDVSEPAPETFELFAPKVEAKAGKGKWTATVTVTNKRALPIVLPFEIFELPGEGAISSTGKAALPGLEDCGFGGLLSGLGGSPVVGIDGGGTLTATATGSLSYSNCKGKKRRVPPGDYKLSISTTVGTVETDLRVTR